MDVENLIRELAITTSSFFVTKNHIKQMAPVWENMLAKHVPRSDWLWLFDLAKQKFEKFPSLPELLNLYRANKVNLQKPFEAK